MKNLPILLILMFGFLLSCNTDADIETNFDESSEEISNEFFFEQFAKNETVLNYAEINLNIENVIIQALEDQQITPDEFRQMVINEDELSLELLFKNTQLVQLYRQRHKAAETVLSRYPNLQSRLDAMITSYKSKEDQEIVLFPFLDQNLSYKCQTGLQTGLFIACGLTAAAASVYCAIYGGIIFGPAFSFTCVLIGYSTGSLCHYGICARR